MRHIILQSLVVGSILLGGMASVHAWGRGGGGAVRVGGFSGGAARVGDVGAARFGEVGGARVGSVGAVSGTRFNEVGAARFGEVGAAKVQHRRRRACRRSRRGSCPYGRTRRRGHRFRLRPRRRCGGRAADYVGAGRAFHDGLFSKCIGRAHVAVRHDFYHYNTFGPAWWTAHPGAWRPYGWPAGRYWGWATWPALTGWFGWNYAPVYFDYGTNIVYQGDQVYVDDQPGPTAAVYYQAGRRFSWLKQRIARDGSSFKRRRVDAPRRFRARARRAVRCTSAVFQLAVNKAGVIGGNYSNVLTGTTLSVRGAVDPKSQRASWIVGDQKDTVYDTGIFNLTKDQSPVLIHFGADRTQQWLLVRIKEADANAAPQQEPQQQANVVPAAPAGEAKGTANVTVIVPADAEITIDGAPTSLTGTERAFVTPPLSPGYNYSYTMRARWTANGVPVEQTRKVTFSAGANVRVDFTGN